jgi:hypothetical protein
MAQNSLRDNKAKIIMISEIIDTNNGDADP